jgi:tRNA pseudouridine55 synthase
MARKGVDVQLEPRTVTIKSFTIEKMELPVVHFRVVCSTGTYIRSLANDYGQQLGSGAYLSSLRRTRIGDFKAEDAWEMEDFIQHAKDEVLERKANS